MNDPPTPESNWHRRSNPLPDASTSSGRPYPDVLLTGTSRTIRSYDSCRQAERAVDHLSDKQFPVEHVAIVGRGLTSVEQVTGRLTYWGTAGGAVVSGALVGALAGWILGAFNLVHPLVASAG